MLLEGAGSNISTGSSLVYIEKRFGRRVTVATVSAYSSEGFFAYGAIRENDCYLESRRVSYD